MQTMTQGTTDERLDRLEERVDEGFLEVDQRFGEVDKRFEEVDKRFDQIDNHFVTANFDEFPRELASYRDRLAGRSMIVRKTNPLPVECVVRAGAMFDPAG